MADVYGKMKIKQNREDMKKIADAGKV